MNSRKNIKLHEKVKPCARAQNNARECKIMAKMQIYPAFTRNNARTRLNSLFFSEKIGRAVPSPTKTLRKLTKKMADNLILFHRSQFSLCFWKKEEFLFKLAFSCDFVAKCYKIARIIKKSTILRFFIIQYMISWCYYKRWH